MKALDCRLEAVGPVPNRPEFAGALYLEDNEAAPAAVEAVDPLDAVPVVSRYGLSSVKSEKLELLVVHSGQKEPKTVGENGAL